MRPALTREGMARGRRLLAALEAAGVAVRIGHRGTMVLEADAPADDALIKAALTWREAILGALLARAIREAWAGQDATELGLNPAPMALNPAKLAPPAMDLAKPARLPQETLKTPVTGVGRTDSRSCRNALQAAQAGNRKAGHQYR